jgi:hypothetical protein
MILQSRPNTLWFNWDVNNKTDQVHLDLFDYKINHSFSKWKTRHTNKSKCLMIKHPSSIEIKTTNNTSCCRHSPCLPTKFCSNQKQITKIFFQQNKRTKANLFKMLSKNTSQQNKSHWPSHRAKTIKLH